MFVYYWFVLNVVCKRCWKFANTFCWRVAAGAVPGMLCAPALPCEEKPHRSPHHLVVIGRIAEWHTDRVSVPLSSVLCQQKKIIIIKQNTSCLTEAFVILFIFLLSLHSFRPSSCTTFNTYSTTVQIVFHVLCKTNVESFKQFYTLVFPPTITTFQITTKSMY